MHYSLRGKVPRVVLAGVTLGLVACAGIVGIDNRALDPELADGSTSGSASAGSAGSGSAGSGSAVSGSTGSGSAVSGSTGSGTSSGSNPDVDGSASDDATTNPGSPDAAADSGTTPGTDGSTVVPACPTPCSMATGLNHPFLMASDAKRVYWTEFGDDWGAGNGSVKGCPLAGCGAGPTTYAPGLTNARGIATDGQKIYFATASYSAVIGGIWSCSVDGCNGTPTPLAAAGIPYGVAVDATYVYWSDNDDSTIHKVPKNGGTDTVIVDAGATTLIEPGQISVDGQYVYVIDANANATRVTISNGQSLLLGTSSQGALNGQPYTIANDATHVFFGGDGIIQIANKNVADSGVRLTNAAYPSGLAIDPQTGTIYWADQGDRNTMDGVVGKISPDGGGRQVLAASLQWAQAVTVSGNSVYWVNWGDLDGNYGAKPSTGTLNRMTK